MCAVDLVVDMSRIDKKNRVGALCLPLAAIEKLARRKGYRLVLCEESGINAFFLRNDIAPAIPGLTVEQAYRPWMDKHDVTGLRKKNIDIDEVIRQSGLPLTEV